MAEQHLITAEYLGSPVSIIDHEGKQWLTAEQAGRCLGYAEKNAGISINKLYRAHADEFTEEDVAALSERQQPAERNLDDIMEDWLTREKARLTASLKGGHDEPGASGTTGPERPAQRRDGGGGCD